MFDVGDQAAPLKDLMKTSFGPSLSESQDTQRVPLPAWSADGSASFRILINPLVSWIWAGGGLLLLGVAFGNLGARRPETVAVVTRPAVVASWP